MQSENTGISEFLRSYATPRRLVVLASLCGALTTIVSFGQDVEATIDSYVVTESEFRDFRTQDKLEKLADDITLLRLQLNHEPDEVRARGLHEQMQYKQRQFNYLECLFNPLMEENECLRN